MTLLNQIVAVEPTVKSETTRHVTDLHRLVQKEPLLSGIARTYTPKDDEGDRLPAERQLVQVKVGDVLESLQQGMTRLFDVVLTKESANCDARADVKVEDDVVLRDIPVTYLLFLEKQLVDVGTFVDKLPVLDPATEWTLDPNTGAYQAREVQTSRTQKVRRNWVKAEATKEHPAQVEVFTEDEIVGTWSTVKFSGAIPATRKIELAERVRKLREAVKFAREAANSVEITHRKAGDAVFGYLFGS